VLLQVVGIARADRPRAAHVEVEPGLTILEEIPDDEFFVEERVPALLREDALAAFDLAQAISLLLDGRVDLAEFGAGLGLVGERRRLGCRSAR
jgi:hypothetical protein